MRAYRGQAEEMQQTGEVPMQSTGNASRGEAVDGQVGKQQNEQRGRLPKATLVRIMDAIKCYEMLSKCFIMLGSKHMRSIHSTFASMR
jgi:hypothetical protein